MVFKNKSFSVGSVISQCTLCPKNAFKSTQNTPRNTEYTEAKSINLFLNTSIGYFIFDMFFDEIELID